MTSAQYHSRDRELTLVLIMLVALFLVTRVVTRLYDGKKAQMAQQWYNRGNADLSDGRAGIAVDDYGNALAYSPANDAYELRLAEALVAAGRAAEARTHFEELWDRTPESGIVNLELARLAAQRSDPTEAVRYYNNAIYGLWQDSSDQQEKRRDTQFELYRFLVGENDEPQAKAQLMLIAAGLPADPALHMQLGKVMFSNGDFQQALAEFRAALEVDPERLDALAGAGRAAFQAGDFPTAIHYLGQAARNKNADASTRQLLDISQAVLDLDPFDPRMGAAERARRASHDFALGLARLVSCARQNGQDLSATHPQQSDIQQLYLRARKMQPQAAQSYLDRNPDEIALLMNVVSELEGTAMKLCGESSDPSDRALVLITAHRGNG